MRLNLGLVVDVLGEHEFGGFGSDLSHLSDQGAVASVVGDPFGVELGLGWGEPAVDGLAVDLRGPLPVGAVRVRRVGVAAAAGLAAPVVAQREAAGADVADVGQLGGEFPVVALVGGQSLRG